MKVAIMQPYFFPYLGYFQLINSVDVFVVYDNIKYVKKTWFNRNRLLQNGKSEYFTISLKKESDFLNVFDRTISQEYNRKKLIAKFQNAYTSAPYKKEIMPLLEKIVNYENNNLFEYLLNSIKETCHTLDIKTKIIISSSIGVDHNLRSSKKVIAICKNLNARTYVNPIGGLELYKNEEFKENNLELKFIKSNQIKYKQFDNEFVPWLSIIDVLMLNGVDNTKKLLGECILI